MLGEGGRVLGLIEFVNKIPPGERLGPESSVSDHAAAAALGLAGGEVFTEDDERVIRLLCAHTATFIKQMES